jgi:3-deoxy-D-manno-octulosonic-acid transferase
LHHLGRAGERRETFSQRMGRFRAKTKQALTNRQKLWIHATSSSAIDLLTGVINALEPRAPLLKIVVSTRTDRGMKRLRRVLPSRVERFYVPFDLPRATLRTLNVIHPEAVLLLEPELPPNLMRRFRQRRTPVILVDGAPQKNRRRHRWLSPLYRPLFAGLTRAVARTEVEADRLRRLGCPPEIIETTNPWPAEPVKLRERRPLDVPDLLRRVGMPSPASIVLGDHLHEGEERLLARVVLKLKNRHPGLFLILIPDRYQRGKEIGRELKALGLRYAYRTAVTAVMQAPAGSVDCLIVNTQGEALQFCEHASLVVLGKTLVASGGENPAEPASLGKAILFGPHVEDHAAMAQSLLESGGACQVADEAALEEVLDGLLADGPKRKAMGRAAKQASLAHRGALERVVDIVLKEMAPEQAEARAE